MDIGGTDAEYAGLDSMLHAGTHSGGVQNVWVKAAACLKGIKMTPAGRDILRQKGVRPGKPANSTKACINLV